MALWIKARGDGTYEVRDTTPPAEDAAWLSAIEVKPSLTEGAQHYGGHTFDVTKTPAEIVWEVLDFDSATAAANLAEIAARPIKMLTEAVQAHLDATAQTHNYDGILSACSYASSTNTTFAAEAAACVAWRDAVWADCYTIMAAVQAGTHAMPTADSLIAELPTITWPA